MPAWAWALIGVGIALAVAFVVFEGLRLRRTRRLRGRFGPEYERTLASHGDRTRAEGELRERERRREHLEIRSLPVEERERYRASWEQVQARFVDDPGGAVTDADGLVGRVMAARGYPTGHFEERSADISVDHPEVVEHYRAAHAIALAQEHGRADTERQREAMVHYRALFEELVETAPASGRSGHDDER